MDLFDESRSASREALRLAIALAALCLLPLMALGGPPDSISGKISDAQSGAPLRGCHVILRSDGEERFVVRTDATGNYRFTNVTPGKYTLSVEKSGYVSGTLNRSSGNSSILTLSRGDELAGIDVRLLRSGVISGTVVDEANEPIPGANVTAVRRVYSLFMVESRESPLTITDDRGQFRIHGLNPARYYIRAAKGARLFEPVGHYAPALHPPSGLAGVELLNVGPGEEVSGIRLVLRESPVYSVSGRVVDTLSGGPVGRTSITVYPEGYSPSRMDTQAGTKPDGTFRLSELTQGRFQMLNATPDSASPGRYKHASRSFVVGEHDIVGFTIVLGAGTTVTGHVVATNDARPIGLRVELSSQLSRTLTAMASSPVGHLRFPACSPESMILTSRLTRYRPIAPLFLSAVSLSVAGR